MYANSNIILNNMNVMIPSTRIKSQIIKANNYKIDIPRKSMNIKNINIKSNNK